MNNKKTPKPGTTSEPIRKQRARKANGQGKPTTTRISKQDRESAQMLIRRGLKPEEVATVLKLSIDTVIAALKEPKKGRPLATVSDHDLAMIEQLSGLGLAKGYIAALVGMSRDTFFTREKDTQSVRDALEKGKAKAQALVASSLTAQAKAGNISAIIWWEKTRAGRNDKLVIEKRVEQEVTDLFEFLEGQLDENTFTGLLERYRNEFCGGEVAEEEAKPEIYR